MQRYSSSDGDGGGLHKVGRPATPTSVAGLPISMLAGAPDGCSQRSRVAWLSVILPRSCCVRLGDENTPPLPRLFPFVVEKRGGGSLPSTTTCSCHRSRTEPSALRVVYVPLHVRVAMKDSSPHSSTALYTFYLMFPLSLACHLLK